MRSGKARVAARDKALWAEAADRATAVANARGAGASPPVRQASLAPRNEDEEWVELNETELLRARSAEAAAEISSSGSQLIPTPDPDEPELRRVPGLDDNAKLLCDTSYVTSTTTRQRVGDGQAAITTPVEQQEDEVVPVAQRSLADVLSPNTAAGRRSWISVTTGLSTTVNADQLASRRDGEMAIVQRYKDEGGGLNDKDNEGYTAMHWAAAMEGRSGASFGQCTWNRLDARGKNGRTPLMNAAENGRSSAPIFSRGRSGSV